MKFWALALGAIFIVGGEVSARGLIERGKRGHKVMGEVTRSFDETAENAKFKDEETRRRFREVDGKLSVAMHQGVDLIPKEYALYALLVRVFTWTAAISIFCLTIVLAGFAKRRGSRGSTSR